VRTVREGSFAPDGCIERTVFSERRQLEYRILIAAPKDKAPEEGYAVVYALDGDATFQTMAEAARLQTRKPKGYDPVLVVGIAYPSKEAFDLERRCRDFTMAVPKAALPPRPDGRAWPPNGEADLFLDFLEHELIPDIAREFPIDAGRRAIAGHSLGGLLALHALYARPGLFTHYAAGSPSVWWGENEVLKEQERFAAQWSGERELHLLLTIGANELEDMLEGANEIHRRMKSLSGRGVRTEYVRFDGEDHVSVLPASLGRIVKFVRS